LYALRIDLGAGTYEVFKPAERSLAALSGIRPVRSGAISPPLRLRNARLGGRDLNGIATLFYGQEVLLPEFSIQVAHDSGCVVSLRINPATDEAEYAEQ
jgi:hypothetical protein